VIHHKGASDFLKRETLKSYLGRVTVYAAFC